MKYILLVFFLFCSFLFLGISFIQWEINPGHWSNGWRFVCGIGVIIIGHACLESYDDNR